MINKFIHRLSEARGRTHRARALAESGWSPAPMTPWVRNCVRKAFPRATPEAVAVGTAHGRAFAVVDCRNPKAALVLHGDGILLEQPWTVHLVLLQLPASLPWIAVTRVHPANRKLPRRWTTGNAEFDHRFLVRCDKDDYAAALLSPYLINFMLGNPALQWRIVGNALVAWNDSRWTPQWTAALVGALGGVANSIPPEVLRTYGREALGTTGLPEIGA